MQQDDAQFPRGSVNSLPVQFKSLLPGQEGCVFFSGHLNLRTAPETGLPLRGKKILTIKLKNTIIILLSAYS
jgi:hypothetical protein